MRKLFRDERGTSIQPARFLGHWWDGSRAYEATGIYFTHLVRLEYNTPRGVEAAFVYDPGKVLRFRIIPSYPSCADANALPF